MVPHKWWRTPVLATGLLLIAQGFRLPAPVKDAATLAWVSGFHLHYPCWHVVFEPFMGAADTLTLFSVHQHKVMLAYVVVGSLLILRRRAWLGFLGYVLFVAWAALLPRPMARLVADNPDVLLINFHSHTAYSHDGRKRFTPERNMAWHADQGFNANFITDHNRIEGSKLAKEMSTLSWPIDGFRSLEGEEASLYKTHLVLLGVHERIDNRPYDSDPAKVPVFVRDMHAKGIPVIASIPEYWLYHWDASGAGRSTVDDFIRWGMDGFEIINSAPVALDFPVAYRLHIVDLCRAHHLYMTGITDNHGWGYATAVWNAMALPGWQQMDPDQMEKAVLQTLKEHGPDAAQVLERIRFHSDTPLCLALSPIASFILYFRGLQAAQTVSWMAWVWLVCGLMPLRQKLDTIVPRT